MTGLVTRISFLVVALGAFVLPGLSVAKDELPEVAVDGLKRIETKKIDAMYFAEGATLEPYKRIYFVDCAVSFRKDWARDYNRDTRELVRGGYEIATELASEVLILRPALVNFDVTAPDLNAPGMSYTIVRGVQNTRCFA